MASDGNALREWSQRHDGYDVSRSLLVRSWLQAMHAAARPLVRRGVSPDAVTAAGVTTAAIALVTPRSTAALCVLTTGFLDGLDGAVAVASGRSSPHGERIDHAADRITDVLFAAALWRAGVSRRRAATLAAATLGYEVTRSRLRGSKLRDVALVTAGERPIRVAVVAAALVVAPELGATTLLALLTGSFGQVLAATRR